MPDPKPITKDVLLSYIRELAKEFRRLSGVSTPAEVILVGGAAVLANYGFREMTYDIDAVIVASSAMKQAINIVGDKHGLPTGWFNADFQRTSSYSSKLFEVSRYLRTYSNILTVRVVSAEYLIAMKLMSGRQYKYDMSDVVGILWEHQKIGIPINRESINSAITTLYGGDATIPTNSLVLLDAVMQSENYESLYNEVRTSEEQSKEYLLEFDSKYPDQLKSTNIDDILSRRNHNANAKIAFLDKLEALKTLEDAGKGKPQ